MKKSIKSKFLIEDPPLDVILNVDADDLESMSRKKLEELSLKLAAHDAQAFSFRNELQDILEIEETPEGSELDQIKFLISKNKSKENLVDTFEQLFDEFSEQNFKEEIEVEDRIILYQAKNLIEILSIVESYYDESDEQIEILKKLKKLKYDFPKIKNEDHEEYISPVEALHELGKKLKPLDLIKSMIGI